jgi:APA family basic amino acid/polyamine antiporter
MMWQMLLRPETRGPSLLGVMTAALGLVIYFLSPKKAPAAIVRTE